MKITNKTVGRAILITILSIPFIEWLIHGCEFFSEEHEWSILRVIVLIVGLSYLFMTSFALIACDIEFEYEIKLPKSNRNTLNKLYSKMGEAAMKGDSLEEKRIWEVIQRIENNNE